MSTYIILSRISSKAFSSPIEFARLAAKVSEKIKNDTLELIEKINGLEKK